MSGLRTQLVVLVSTCVLAVVLWACFSWANSQLPSSALDARWIADPRQDVDSQPNFLRAVSSVAFSPDGKRIAAGMTFSGGSGSEKPEHWISLWDATTGHQELTLKGHAASVQGLAFSPDGKRIASASWDNTAKVWDVTKGHEILTFKGHSHMVTCVAFNPDGKRIATGCWDRSVKVWDSTNGAVPLSLNGHPYPVMCVAFSPDGKRIAASGAIDTNAIKVWDTTTGQETLSIADCSDSLMFSPDGKRIASAWIPPEVRRVDGVYSNGYGLAIWDQTDGRKLLTLKGHSACVSSVAFSPDGKRIASGSADMSIKVWDAIQGKEIFTIKRFAENVTSVAFSPNGEQIASGDGSGTVKVWEAATGKELLSIKLKTSH